MPRWDNRNKLQPARTRKQRKNRGQAKESRAALRQKKEG